MWTRLLLLFPNGGNHSGRAGSPRLHMRQHVRGHFCFCDGGYYIILFTGLYLLEAAYVEPRTRVIFTCFDGRASDPYEMSTARNGSPAC